MSGTVGDARKRLAESVSAANEVSGVSHQDYMDALAWLETNIPLDKTGHVPGCGYDNELACGCATLAHRLAERILAARLSAREPDNEACLTCAGVGHVADDPRNQSNRTEPCPACCQPVLPNDDFDAHMDCRTAAVPVSGVPTEADEVERIIAAKNRYRADRDEAWAELENHVCAPGVPTEAVREVWGIQRPPSVFVEREYPERRWAEKQLPYYSAGGCLLVRRFVTEWEPALVQRAAETNESGTPHGNTEGGEMS